MAKGSYATKQILNWMEYFSKEMQVSPEKIKLLDICGKQKNTDRGRTQTCADFCR